jgi:hypothetical protein
MARKTEIDRLREAVRRAEADLDTAVKLSDVKIAAAKLQRAKAALKTAEEVGQGNA